MSFATARLVALAFVVAALAACTGESPPPVPETLELRIAERLEVGESASFSTTDGADVSDLSWHWDFGDGHTSNSSRPAHAYTAAGRYEVMVEVSNGAGARVSARRQLSVGYFARLAGRDCNAAQQRGWCWQQPIAAAAVVNDVHFADGLHGLAVGELGRVLATGDGGASWQLLPNAGAETLRWVRLWDAQLAYAISARTNTLLRSSDGGRHWKAVGTIPLSTVQQLWLIDARTLVASGLGPGFATLSKVSADGGASWTSAALHVTEVSRDGTLWGARGRRVSHDLGVSVRSTWPCCVDGLVVGSALDDPSRIHIVSLDVAAAGSTAPVYQYRFSSDGGRSFVHSAVQLPVMPEGASVSSMRIQSDGSGVAWVVHQVQASNGSSYPGWSWLTTRDGGRSWQRRDSTLRTAAEGFRVPDDPYADARAVWYWLESTKVGGIGVAAQAVLIEPDGTLGLAITVPGELDPPRSVRRWAAGRLLVGFGSAASQRWYSSPDSGRSWVPLPGQPVAGADSGSSGLWFFDAREGLRLQHDGVLMATDDGGRSWSQRAIVGSGWADSRGLHFVDEATGWVVASGQLLRTDDRGRQWRVVAVPHANVTWAQFVDARIGWVAAHTCTSDGQLVLCIGGLYRTDDAGRSWQALPMSPDAYQPVAFADSQFGAIVDYSGAILHTADGGRSWASAALDTPLQSGARTIRFDRQGRGWVLPVSGPPRVLRSVDGGRSWRTVMLPTPGGPLNTTGLNGIVLADRFHGWIVGDAGLVLATDDGGDTWRVQASGTETTLTTVFALDAMTAWIAGAYPAWLLTTSTGGAP